jgi:hypothetical protein
MTLAEELAARLDLDLLLCERLVQYVNKQLVADPANFLDRYQFLFFSCHCPPDKRELFVQKVALIVRESAPDFGTVFNRIEDLRQLWQ